MKEASIRAIHLSVLNHESKRLEHDAEWSVLSACAIFQYSTTSRNGWNRRRLVRRGPLRRDFQYSTTSRNGWNRSASALRCAFVQRFQYSTTSRNGWNMRQATPKPAPADLSVLNHESKRLEPAEQDELHFALAAFQYSTTSRNGWNHEEAPRLCQQPGQLSVLNHESKRLELILSKPTVTPSPAFSTQPRVETAGTCSTSLGCARSSLSVLNHESKRLELKSRIRCASD